MEKGLKASLAFIEHFFDFSFKDIKLNFETGLVHLLLKLVFVIGDFYPAFFKVVLLSFDKRQELFNAVVGLHKTS